MGIIADAKAELSWLADQGVPVGGHYDVYRDAADGVVDYSAAINPAPIAAWPDGEGKRGFGRGLFGDGRFGHGGVGLAFGDGVFGAGRFGYGGRRVTCRTPPLADGTWTFAVLGVDDAGNPASAGGGSTVAVALAGTPAPPTDLEAAYAAGTLTLTWTLSTDDEG